MYLYNNINVIVNNVMPPKKMQYEIIYPSHSAAKTVTVTLMLLNSHICLKANKLCSTNTLYHGKQKAANHICLFECDISHIALVVGWVNSTNF